LSSLPKFAIFCEVYVEAANGLLQRILLPNPLLSEKTTFVVYCLLHLDMKKTILQPQKEK
jgi:hypothetical protein